ncbi:AAA domain-containing protein [Halorientalis regularis]|uniref:DNA helicase n=1 Tax=Halorientalis regularis TaxID=660518 RepID=A0A1G7MVI1_9EURY|nr:AAA domain-containing protein [Halorientalis regularis]SDF65697.1 DNA replication ATP-dependent helicase Dna2 [Halorientalis regularis]
MQLRGPVVEVGDIRTVETSRGTSDLAEVRMRPDSGQAEAVTVTLWGKWTETTDYLDPGMELLVTNVEEDEFRGEIQYATQRESMVVVEPGFLVDVTDVRSWVQCPRMYYLNKLSGLELAYPVVKGTIVHEVFGDLLRGRDLDDAIDERVAEAGLELGLLDKDPEAVAAEVRDHASAIEGWLRQGTLTDTDGAASAADSSERGFSPVENEWRSEQTLVSETYGLKGRADAVRRGGPVELKTGKNTKREPRFQDKIQAACYALLLGEQAVADGGAETATDGGQRSVPDGDHADEAPDTGTLLYTKNAAVERTEETGDLSPAKEFSLGPGLLKFVVRTRNEIAAMEHDVSVPTGFEADAKCEYCFEQDTCMAVSGRLDQESKAGQVGSPIPEDEREYFDRFYRAIEAERRAVHREYTKLWRQSGEERAEDDRALIDLEPIGQTERDGGRWELRAQGTSAVSKIREGDVVLASDGHPVRGRTELARVEELGEEVVVTTDEPVELRRLDVYPSEIGTDRMLTALHDAVLKQSPEKKAVLFGRREPEFGEDDTVYIDNNEAQNEAVSLAVRAEDVALIHGPPGTGKTYTLARTVRALVERGERVLLTAFTNRAVDNAIEALEDQGFEDIVRMGTETGVRPDMQAYRLPDSGDPQELAGRLRDASVVAATTASCGSTVMREQSFDVALVDEAGQLTEPATLAAVSLADKSVLVGDHQQLPPVVQAADDDEGGAAAPLQTSLFERLIEQYPDAGVMLGRQYRMSQRIQAFASREFYDGQLRPATGEVASQRIDDLAGVETDALPPNLRDSVAFVDPDGQARGNTNPVEAAAVVGTVQSYVDAGVPPEEIGVIAPYRAQVAEINKRAPAGVTVDTVDRFQGSSKAVIVVSFVATDTLDGPIFEDYRRINVALTRAKKALVLVGDADALGTDPVYGRMVEWAR